MSHVTVAFGTVHCSPMSHLTRRKSTRHVERQAAKYYVCCRCQRFCHKEARARTEGLQPTRRRCHCRTTTAIPAAAMIVRAPRMTESVATTARYVPRRMPLALPGSGAGTRGAASMREYSRSCTSYFRFYDVWPSWTSVARLAERGHCVYKALLVGVGNRAVSEPSLEHGALRRAGTIEATTREGQNSLEGTF
jgi:hypothetical protein